MIAVTAAMAFAPACSEANDDSTGPTAAEGEPELAPLEARLREKCSTCHGFPSPEVIPARAWPSTIEKMFKLANLRLPSTPDQKLLGFTPAEAAAWFVERAPEELDVPSWVAEPGGPSVLPGRAFMRANETSGRPPAVANVRLLRLDGDNGPLSLVVCDMLGERVLIGDPQRPEAGLDVIARLPAPARVEPADLDGDGRVDLIVSVLGDPGPTDDRVGAVVWLRRTESGTFEHHELATRLGRVAETRVVDFDGDGDLDIFCAVFGWYTTGELLLLENMREGDGPPTFRPTTLDRRSGALNIAIADLDGDDRVDFVTVLSQEHERVLAFLGRGGRAFQEVVLHDAGQPHFGYTGLAPTDFDGDGDVDFLVTNGDTLDDEIKMKPYHGVAWLENRGDVKFERHEIGFYPGAHRALAVDLDGDGDLDVVASSFLPGIVEGAPPGLVWFERRDDGSFAPHTLLDEGAKHATVDAADIDGDGLPDLVVGNITVQEPFPDDIERMVEVLLSTER